MENIKKISIFGGTGFIGGNFVNMFPNNTILIPRDIRTPKSSEILYFISTTHNYHVFNSATFDVRTNLGVLTEVFNRLDSKKNKCFNFISSWFVYGDIKNLPAKETDNKYPKGFYSITKSCAEDLVISFCKTFGIDYRIIRLSNVYGVSDKGFSKKKNALQYLIGRIKEDKEIDLYWDGNFVRDYIHVKDACRAIKLILDSGEPNSIYNVGSGVAHNFRDMVEYCYSYLGKEQKIKKVNPTDFHKIVQTKDMFLDVTKLKSLGFKQKIDIYDGLKEICNS